MTRSTWVLVALGLALSASVACAAVYTVTPANYQSLGWSLTTTYGAEGGFSVAPPGATGAFFGNTTGHMTADGRETGQVILGTNRYSGVKFGDIRKLTYRCFTGDFDTYQRNRFPRTPFQLQFCTAKSGQTVPSRYLMYRAWDWTYSESAPLYPSKTSNVTQQQCYPYGGEGVPVPGSSWSTWYNEWQEYDCTTSEYGCWRDYLGLNLDNNSRPFTGDWSYVLKKYGNGASLATPNTTNHEWANTWGLFDGHNPNHTSLNLVIGSPCASESPSGNATVFLSWQDNLNERAFLDYFTIGYNSVPGDASSYVEDTYYFRPDPDPKSVYATNAAAARKGAVDGAKMKNYFVVSGWVLSDMSSSEFTICDDPNGNGTKLKVKCLNHWERPGDYVRIKGVLDRNGADGSMPAIFTQQDDISWFVP